MVSDLPVELLQQILETLWHMPLTSRERTTLMTASALVGSTWADLFDRISSRDVYLTSPTLSEHFLEQVRASSQPKPKPQSPSILQRFFGLGRRAKSNRLAKRSPNLACRTLTLQITNPTVHPRHKHVPDLPMGFVLDDILEHVDAYTLLPNLRTLAIEYIDAPFDDLFQRIGLAALPQHVAHLDVRWTYSSGMPTWLAGALREKQGQQRQFKWAAKSVERVSIWGAGENIVKDLRRICPNARIESR
ncbi:hypothetical protein C8F01DRAFT_747324 [Mycena amicta]|nr:hypothetical protein C8F01DRAFT_747324 [Mycena amicta]